MSLIDFNHRVMSVWLVCRRCLASSRWRLPGLTKPGEQPSNEAVGQPLKNNKKNHWPNDSLDGVTSGVSWMTSQLKPPQDGGRHLAGERAWDSGERAWDAGRASDASQLQHLRECSGRRAGDVGNGCCDSVRGWCCCGGSGRCYLLVIIKREIIGETCHSKQEEKRHK